MKKAALHNLGCKVNAYETEVMEQLLRDDGYTIVPFSEEADVYVINTCSVTNIADRKSRQMIRRAKSKNPDAIVVAAGCYVQTATMAGKSPEDFDCDILIGNNEKHRLVEEINAFRISCRKEALIDDINDGVPEYEELFRILPKEHTRAFVKIQDGCNQFCSYCIIPYARGRVRSRDMESILSEVRGLAQNGFKEVVLTGIHVTSYHIPEEAEFIDVIEAVEQIPGIERIRLGSLEPQVCTEEFCKRLSALKKVCPQFHLSMQSGCDATLLRMNRKYDTKGFEEGCKRLRTYFADPAITTDVIVGFPGETLEEFDATVDFVQRIAFYEMHVFKYSKRKGTRAAEMEGQLSEGEKEKRSAKLIALGNELAHDFRSRQIQRECAVLFEEETVIDGENYWTGFTEKYVRVAVRSDKNLKNTLHTGRITGFLKPDIMTFEFFTFEEN
ncbi:MAG: tRNA (N(6)-L-threonylcarbamoyladenosine(37)-C(2))-methylthiotransferase MtaB [Lachnospiraceae bacterium]|nr:tRNA (N(6)-L-threonylcarbamoyladenosine(37)-C(2))-methylthiotransferase MtaB [Lachnospiraceae bacterium]